MDAGLLVYPKEPVEMVTTDPKQAAKVIVLNNNEAANTRTQLIKLINKIKAIQNFEVEKDGN